MDPERKTLAELSKEVKEKKYITLDTASKLSGYTIEYLERLCRLDKLEHRLIAKGGFAIELQSLLRETHTLLISDSEIDFVDQRELAPPVVEVVTPADVPLVEPIVLPVSRAPRAPAPAPATPPPAPATTPASIYSEYGDEWDALLLGSVVETPPVPPPAPTVPPVSLYHTPSVYRPVTTTADPLPHRDPAPLFPVLDKGETKKEDVPPRVAPVSAPAMVAPTPSAPQVSTLPPSPVPPPPQVAEERVASPVAPPVVPPLAPTPIRTLAQAPSLSPAPSASHLPEISPEHHLAIPESHALMEE